MDHNIFINKLYYIITGIILDLIKTYVTKRKQHVRTKDHLNDNIITERRVPQGTVLDPLHFLTYITDIF